MERPRLARGEVIDIAARLQRARSDLSAALWSAERRPAPDWVIQELRAALAGVDDVVMRWEPAAQAPLP